VNNTTVQNGFTLAGSGPRHRRESGRLHGVGLDFEWPAGGAAAGSQIVFDLDCKKGAA
jgi:hypothetical protein